MSKKVLFIFVLVVLLISISLVFESAPVAAQEPYVWPQPWQTQGWYNQGVQAAAQNQWGEMQTPYGQQWAAGQELYKVLATEAAAAASAVADTTFSPIFMVPVTPQTTYDNAGSCTSSYDWYTGTNRTVCNY